MDVIVQGFCGTMDGQWSGVMEVNGLFIWIYTLVFLVGGFYMVVFTVDKGATMVVSQSLWVDGDMVCFVDFILVCSVVGIVCVDDYLENKVCSSMGIV